MPRPRVTAPLSLRYRCVSKLTPDRLRGQPEQRALSASRPPARHRFFEAGPGHPRTTPDRVLTDKAYSSRANRDLLARRRIAAVIPVEDDQRAELIHRKPTAPTPLAARRREPALGHPPPDVRVEDDRREDDQERPTKEGARSEDPMRSAAQHRGTCEGQQRTATGRPNELPAYRAVRSLTRKRHGSAKSRRLPLSSVALQRSRYRIPVSANPSLR